jgi:sugar/nucleoside kinase (ribokinase family)
MADTNDGRDQRPTERSYEVIASGHMCLDLLPEMRQVPLAAMASPGHLFEIGPVAVATGGSVANTGQALHILGVDVGLMTNVGDDLIGKLILETLNRRDPSLSRLVKVRGGEPSSCTLVLAPENGDRIFLHCTGTNSMFGPDSIDFDLAARATIFHLGYPPILPRLMEHDGAHLREIFERLYTAGTITSLDTSMPDPAGLAGRVDWPRLLAGTLPYVDVFVPSIEEIAFMLRRADYEAWQGHVLPNLTLGYLQALAADLLAMGVAVTGFKLSRYGLYLRTTPDRARLGRLARLPIDLAAWAGFEGYHPAFLVEVGGTTGAGDSAYAALLTALLRGLPPAEALRMTCAVAGCNVEVIDAVNGVRSWEATQARLNAGWPLRPERLAGIPETPTIP